MKITFISDTHGKHESVTPLLKGGDILIHCGDVMNNGDIEEELNSFCKWFDSIDNYKYKIFIAGNHDILFEMDSKRAKETVDNYKSIIYLQDESIIIQTDNKNSIKIYGSPWQPTFYNWAFNLPRGKSLKLNGI